MRYCNNKKVSKNFKNIKINNNQIYIFFAISKTLFMKFNHVSEMVLSRKIIIIFEFYFRFCPTVKWNELLNEIITHTSFNSFEFLWRITFAVNILNCHKPSFSVHVTYLENFERLSRIIKAKIIFAFYSESAPLCIWA